MTVLKNGPFLGLQDCVNGRIEMSVLVEEIICHEFRTACSLLEGRRHDYFKSIMSSSSSIHVHFPTPHWD